MFLENDKHRMPKGEKPFTCNECSKSYSGQWNLKTHIITHSGRSNKLNKKSRKDLKPVPADSPDRRDYVSSGLSIVVITYWHHLLEGIFIMVIFKWSFLSYSLSQVSHFSFTDFSYFDFMWKKNKYRKGHAVERQESVKENHKNGPE